MKEILVSTNSVDTDPLTIAYLAIGAKNYLAKLSESEQSELIEAYSGEANAIAHVIQNAQYLDDFWEQHKQYLDACMFAYEVVEPFGERYFRGENETSEDILKKILRETLTKEDYDGIYPPTAEPAK